MRRTLTLAGVVIFLVVATFYAARAWDDYQISRVILDGEGTYYDTERTREVMRRLVPRVMSDYRRYYEESMRIGPTFTSPADNPRSRAWSAILTIFHETHDPQLGQFIDYHLTHEHVFAGELEQATTRGALEQAKERAEREQVQIAF